MGGGKWNDTEWLRYATTHVTNKESVDAIYTSRKIHNDLDPKNIIMRESCDSADNPNSTALIVALDVTGSMSSVLDSVAREGLKTLATEVYARKPVSDPHIMFMGVGDVECDNAPLQATQFEADIRIAEQLTKIYFERGGGGNNYESYILPWYFASMNTRIDCFEKRKKKGFLFTIGDELPTPYITGEHIKSVFGIDPQFDKLTAEELLTMVSRQYEVFHIIIEEGSYFRRNGDEVVKQWTNLLGQRAIRLADHKKLSEVIVSALQVTNGADTASVVSSWSDKSTALVVEKAISALDNSSKSIGGIVRF